MKHQFVKIFILLTGLCLFKNFIYGQSITGYVCDAYTKHPLPGANVILEGTRIGAAANQEGKYFIENVPIGEAILKVTYLGYHYQIKEITVASPNQILDCSFELKSGPSFAESTTYLTYHNALQEAFSNNPGLIELKVKKYKMKNGIELTLQIVNNWDRAIYLPKKNFHGLEAYTCELIDIDDKPVKTKYIRCGTGAKGFYTPDDIVRINAYSKKTLEQFLISNPDVDFAKNIKHVKFRITYRFDITKPLNTYELFNEYPSPEALAVLEDTHCKLLRVILESGYKRLK